MPSRCTCEYTPASIPEFGFVSTTGRTLVKECRKCRERRQRDEEEYRRRWQEEARRKRFYRLSETEKWDAVFDFMESQGWRQ